MFKLFSWIADLFTTPEEKLLKQCQSGKIFYLETFFKTINPNEPIQIGQHHKFSKETLININQQDEHGNTLLHYLGATYWRCCLGTYLLAKGADANILNNKGETPLKRNIRHCFTETCLSLIQATNQENINRIYPDGETILTAWFRDGTLFWCHDIILTLLKQGADLSRTNQEGHTPLYYLARRFDKEYLSVHRELLSMFILLTEHGATFTPDEVKELSVLKKTHSAPYLLLGIPNDLPKQDTQDLLHTLIHQYDNYYFRNVNYHLFDNSNEFKHTISHIIDKVIQITPDINQQNDKGETPLMAAIQKYGYGKMFALKLIQAGADVCTTHPQTKGTLLHSLRDTQLLVDLLNLKQIDVNAVDKDGNTALHYATLHNDRAIIDKLLQAGACCTIQNNDGLTVFDIAKTQHPTTAQMIRLIELETENKQLKQLIASQRSQQTPAIDRVNEG